MDRARIFTLQVKPMPQTHSGFGRALLHHSVRNNARRHRIFKITNTSNGQHVLASCIGNEAVGKEDEVFLDYGFRRELSVQIGDQTDFEIREVGRLGVLVWYLRIADPMIRVPAWLAFVSVVLGVFAAILAVASG